MRTQLLSVIPGAQLRIAPARPTVGAILAPARADTFLSNSSGEGDS